SRYGPWKHVIQQYVAGMEKDRAISLILSYIQGENVKDYKEVLSTAHYDGDRWRHFKDSNETSRAQSKLPYLKMRGGMTAQDFFTQWEQLCTKAGYTNHDDPFLLHLLQQAIRPDIMERLYVSGNAP
ncbi:hypothetical protein C8Q79DRAFT_884667, partial [Trametes meyenii]